MSEKRPTRKKAVEPRTLDVGYLGLFVGYAFASVVEEQLAREGYGDLRFSHGFLFQHLIEGPRTLGELAERLEVTQQAASKSVAELEGLGYVERVADPEDARVRRVRLSERGHAAVSASRRIRAEVEHRLEERHGARALAQARVLLSEVLDSLGGVSAVRARRVLPPR